MSRRSLMHERRIAPGPTSRGTRAGGRRRGAVEGYDAVVWGALACEAAVPRERMDSHELAVGGAEVGRVEERGEGGISVWQGWTRHLAWDYSSPGGRTRVCLGLDREPLSVGNDSGRPGGRVASKGSCIGAIELCSSIYGPHCWNILGIDQVEEYVLVVRSEDVDFG
ncbi:hypothetical protein BV22DRAFT_1046029 [Leucogyrophana mollusca]|uniref:Uncharacterized protein n=1 Tax=Leucogyrophana mollusca TaxID=85980 RepID=A0ACB8BNV1_9AGAM|nr:hypothetical protein BV22DRAFT_1046029 [Leucogyrophana mollusca]